MKLGYLSKMFVLPALLIVALDQSSKFWALAMLTDAYQQNASWLLNGQRFLWLRHPHPLHVVEVFSSWWHFRYVENPGAAWGFLSDVDHVLRTPLFLGISMVAVFFIVNYVRKVSLKKRWVHVGLGLIMGGALGNFFDRIRLGYVIDFIDWHYLNYYTWPTFNVADSAITSGVALLLIDSYWLESSYKES